MGKLRLADTKSLAQGLPAELKSNPELKALIYSALGYLWVGSALGVAAIFSLLI